MAKGGEVLEMLLPNGGWIIVGDDFDSIQYLDGIQPITKKQFEDGFAVVDAWKAKQDAAKAEAKSAVYEKLGLTAEEVAALLA